MTTDRDRRDRTLWPRRSRSVVTTVTVRGHRDRGGHWPGPQAPNSIGGTLPHDRGPLTLSRSLTLSISLCLALSLTHTHTHTHTHSFTLSLAHSLHLSLSSHRARARGLLGLSSSKGAPSARCGSSVPPGRPRRGVSPELGGPPAPGQFINQPRCQGPRHRAVATARVTLRADYISTGSCQWIPASKWRESLPFRFSF